MCPLQQYRIVTFESTLQSYVSSIPFDQEGTKYFCTSRIYQEECSFDMFSPCTNHLNNSETAQHPCLTLPCQGRPVTDIAHTTVRSLPVRLRYSHSILDTIHVSQKCRHPTQSCIHIRTPCMLSLISISRPHRLGVKRSPFIRMSRLSEKPASHSMEDELLHPSFFLYTMALFLFCAEASNATEIHVL